MKGREGKGPPTTDLLVCFPTRAHLTLMPKAICSPVRPPDHLHHHHSQRRLSHHQMRKSTTNRGGQASPVLWAKTKPNNSDNSEPTSPKVTCAGQIKIKPKPNSCKNWQSVMEEIERIHNRKQKKRPPWIEALGFKKDVMQFLTCLRKVSFDFRCFGSFPSTDITSDDEDEDEDDEDEDQEVDEHENISKEEIEENEEDPKAVFSKWFMVFQENNRSKDCLIDEDDDDEEPCVAPPKNALLLMRCRSAPAKTWLEEKEEEEEEEEEEENYNRNEKEEEEEERQRKTEEVEKQRKTEEEEKLMVMRCGTDFSKFSSDIAKETWVVGGINDLLSRSKSWKR